MDKRRFQPRSILVILGMTIGFVGWVGCATSSNLRLPTAERLSLSGVVTDGVSVESLERGRIIAVTECASCHRHYQPGDYSPSEWRSLVRRMAKRSSLSRDQTTDLEHYYSAANRAALGKDE